MNKLKNLAGYLPYELKGIIDNKIEILCGIVQSKKSYVKTRESLEGEIFSSELIHFRPIFRPISMLTEWIEHNGEKFIPVIELAKLVDNQHNHTDSIVKTYKNMIKIITEKCDDIYPVSIYFEEKGITSISSPNGNISYVTYEKVKDKLFEWHFCLNQSMFNSGEALSWTEAYKK